MRGPGIRLHKLALFGWAVLVTAVLLLLSLPVLAGNNVVPALNLAVCWKLWYITQSAGNLLSLYFLGILRDNMPKFVCCISFVKKALHMDRLYSSNYTISKNNINKEFAHYIAGLIEGDGTIHVAKSKRSVKGNINYPSIQIVFHVKNLPLALLIQKELGHGSICRKKGVNAYIYTINNFKGLKVMIDLLNGNLKTNKLFALHRLIDWHNEDKTTCIEKKGLNTEPILSNGWLSGFIESNGYFSVRSSETSKYPKIECKFELTQSQKDSKNKNNLYFLKQIADSIESVVKSTRNETKNPQYRITTTNIKANLMLVDYLIKYPLFGTKLLDFKDWIKVIELFSTKKGFFNHKLNMHHVKHIKSNMNNKRTIFVWDHLQNFYNLNK